MKQNKTLKKVKVEYSTLYSEIWERNFMVRTIGYGKPGAVFKEINDYYKARSDLELIDSEQFTKEVMLRHTADQPVMIDDNTVGYINGITFKMICVREYYLIRNEKMEDLLSYYEECMGARRDRRNRKESEKPEEYRSSMEGGESIHIASPKDSKGSFFNAYLAENLSPEQRKHLKTIMEKEVLK